MGQKKVASGLSALVESKLKDYFQELGGTRPSCGLYGQIMEEVERPLIEVVLSVTQGNKGKAAELLGINRNTLRKKIEALEIEVI